MPKKQTDSQDIRFSTICIIEPFDAYGWPTNMRTTLLIDEELLAQARRATGLREKTAVVHAGLRALIERAYARRLVALGGTEPGLRVKPRRRARLGRAR
jgi:Arc/MetJ family transcription regulator